MADLPKLTRNQSLVFDALNRRDGPASAYVLLDDLRAEGFRAPLQVYRALDKLMETGLVHRLESLNAFVACAHRHDHGHDHDHGVIAFAICQDCGGVEEFSDAAIGERLAQWSAGHGFRPAKTIIEMRGACAACAA